MNFIKKISTGIAFCAGAIGFSTVLYAQEVSGDEWSLQECLNYASENNIQLRTERLDVISSASNLEAAKAARLPSLGASLSHSVNNGRGTDPVVGGFLSQSSQAGNYGISSRWTLYNGGAVRKNIEQQKLIMLSAGLDVQEVKNDITLAITEAFLNTLYAGEYINYALEIREASTVQLDNSKNLLDAGSITLKDFSKIQAQLANDEFTLVSARNLYQQQLLTLKQILQVPAAENFAIETPEQERLILAETVPGKEEVIALALNNLPEIKNSALGVEIARLEVEKARAQYLPDLTMSGSLSSGFNDNHNLEYFDQVNQNFYQRAGVSLNIPVFNNKLTKNKVDVSRINLDKAKLQQQGAELELVQDVEMAYLRLENGMAKLEASQAQLDAAEESYRIANNLYKEGMSTATELFQEKALYINALDNFVEAKYQLLYTQKLLDFYMGKPILL